MRSFFFSLSLFLCKKGFLLATPWSTYTECDLNLDIFFRNNIYIYLGAKSIKFTFIILLFFFINIIIQRHLYKAFQWHPLGLKRTRLVISLSWLPLFISRCHLIIYIYCLQNDGKCCQARAEWIFQTSLSFFSHCWEMSCGTRSLSCVLSESHLICMFVS